jgi:hypothetical protein
VTGPAQLAARGRGSTQAEKKSYPLRTPEVLPGLLKF